VRRSILTFVIFLLVITVVVGGSHYYLWQRLLRATALDRRWQIIGARVLIALAIAMPLSMFLIRILPRTPGMTLAFTVYTWMGLGALLVSILLISEIARVALYAGSSLLGRPLDDARRTFISRVIAAGAGLVAGGLAIAGAASALGTIVVMPVKVALRRLPPSLRGFRIVQLSDVHIGPTIGRSWLAEIVGRVNALDPDLVVITGDLVDGSVAHLREHVAPLADLRAKFGVYFVTGNHEYYSGATEWIEELGRLGVRVLRNERVSIGEGDASFDLAGVDDWTAGDTLPDHGPDLGKAVAGRDERRELILLAHQPRQIFEAATQGVGLMLSGHTHGGQLFPITMMVRLQQPYVAGLSRHNDTQIYVSRGTGYWGPPIRVGAPPEITLIELEPAPAQASS
jgi:uncharacterized protein